jgi:hypothetical protein
MEFPTAHRFDARCALNSQSLGRNAARIIGLLARSPDWIAREREENAAHPRAHRVNRNR